MDEIHIHDLEQSIRQKVDNVAKDRQKDSKWDQRAERRAIALNGVDTARLHAGRQEQPYTQNDADIIVAIMELLDRVAESTT